MVHLPATRVRTAGRHARQPLNPETPHPGARQCTCGRPPMSKESFTSSFSRIEPASAVTGLIRNRTSAPSPHPQPQSVAKDDELAGDGLWTGHAVERKIARDLEPIQALADRDGRDRPGSKRDLRISRSFECFPRIRASISRRSESLTRSCKSSESALTAAPGSFLDPVGVRLMNPE